jgi:hypothetical protein
VSEFLAALSRHGGYRGSSEELTTRPWRDPCSLLLLAVTAAVALARPVSWTFFTGGSVAAYALTPEAWTTIRQHRPEQDRQTPRPSSSNGLDTGVHARLFSLKPENACHLPHRLTGVPGMRNMPGVTL